MFAQADHTVRRSLDCVPGETWRDAEARMFLLVIVMLDGRLPWLQRFSGVDRRRLGYLAEFAALIVGAPNADDLLAYADQARRLARSDASPEVIALVPGGSLPRGSNLDALAAEWGFHPGLDVSRYRAEAPALVLEAAT